MKGSSVRKMLPTDELPDIVGDGIVADVVVIDIVNDGVGGDVIPRQHQFIIEGAKIPPVDIVLHHRMLARRCRTYPIQCLTRIIDSTVEVLLWPEYFRFYSWCIHTLDHARTVYSVHPTIQINWRSRARESIQLRPNCKPCFVVLYLTATQFCVVFREDLRKRERRLKKKFIY